MATAEVVTAAVAAERAVRAADQDPASALPIAERAVALARRERDPAAGAAAERAWGHALVHCGELTDAIAHFRRSVALGHRAQSPTLVAEARQKLAFAVMQRGRPRAALAEIDAALVDLRGSSAGRARAQRAIILHVIGRLDESLQEYEVALRVLRQSEDRLGVQRMLINRALVHADRHAFPAARRDLAEAEILAGELGRELTIGIIENNLGTVESLYGDVPAALAHLARAEKIVAAHGAQLGTLHQDRAELLLSVGLVTEAQDAARKAIDAYRREARLVKIPEVRLLSVQAAMLDHDWPTAIGQARQAVREFSGQDRPEWVGLARLATLRAQLASGVRPRITADALEDMLDTLSRAGWPAAVLEARLVAARLSEHRDADRASAFLAVAARSAAGRGPASLRARGWFARAVMQRSAGNGRGALRAARSGLQILAEHSASMSATDLRVHAAVHRTELVDIGMGLAFESGNAGTIFEWAERGRASHLLNRRARPPHDPELNRLLVDLRALTREDDSKRAPAGRSGSARQVALEQHIRDRSRVLRGNRVDRPTDPATPGAIGKALGDWVLVEYVQRRGELFALTLVDGRARLHALGPLHVIADLTERVPFALRRMAATTAGPGSGSALLLQKAAQRLDALLLEPLPELADRPLVVVPTGPMHSLPWSILPSCLGRPVTVSPSATLWYETTLRHTILRHEATLGDATPGQFAGPSGAVSVIAGPTLPGAAHEAQVIAELYRTQPVNGSAATVGRVLEALSTSGIVHLAAHGRLSAENPLFSEIALSDGSLVAYDLEQLSRVPNTVVLATCESGRSVVHTGDELIGLGVTFLACGASQLVASVVPVPDAETTPLMVAFHGHLTAGRPAAAALALAQQELVDLGDDRSFAAAAGFICVGTGDRVSG